ncbi:MAG TPA: Type 1 glutamine amidotransferase-like domain-containing protein [Candidatus Saccharimonadales bacterium]|nr:Type 1 glutamine amidotransferase-like domain-containing protein [Candidatus Saccharimonadales bacterium]
MKLLLTSGGVRNKGIADALKGMVGKPASETKIAFIPTAANVEGGNKDWYVGQFLHLWRFGYCWIDVVDPSAANVNDWKERLGEADVIFVSGGNTFHLLEQARATGLLDWLKQHIKSKVYVGSSAGSILVTPTIAVGGLTGADNNINNLQDLQALAFVPFEFIPHTLSFFTMEAVQDYAKSSPHPVYAVDDTTAIKVVNGKSEVISEGFWRLLNN